MGRLKPNGIKKLRTRFKANTSKKKKVLWYYLKKTGRNKEVPKGGKTRTHYLWLIYGGKKDAQEESGKC